MQIIRVGLLAAGMALAAASAQALTFTTNNILPTPSANQLAPTTNSADFRLDFVGSDLSAPAPNSRTPWEGTAFENTATYNSVEAGGFAEYVFGSARSFFSLMWGSPDDYNTLEFLLGGISQGTLTGDQVDDPPPAGTGFVNVFVTDVSFDTVRFTSTQDAFEYAEVSAVPLPAAGWLLVSAMAGFGYMSRRRRG